MIAIDEDEAVPTNAHDYSGLCFMGGPMSVNDPLPWIEQSCALIRSAIAAGIPVIGHCLGGQLMSKALGGAITRNPVKEIGWGDAYAEGHAVGKQWLGDLAGKSGSVFQWHGETFSIPPGATRLFSNNHCANQMFALGPHLAMQCHIEMTPEMITTWNEEWAGETQGVSDQVSVQTPESMASELAMRLPQMRQLSDQLYSVWIGGLAR